MADKYESFYSNQTVFLTGGTGGLGTCILHKLVTELPTKKIYVLVRSKEKALRTWKASIPNQVDAIVNSDRVVFVLGDISKVNLGIETSMRAQMRADTTVVINSAADTSFGTTLLQAVKSNALSTLGVADFATSFPHLLHFTQISTAYTSAFLPSDGYSVSETMHSFYDPEAELDTILKTGTSKHLSRFPWIYSFSKHLAEQLLVTRFGDKLPLAIVRPSCIGSAVRSPYAGYGPAKAMPIEMFWRMHALNPGNRVFRAPVSGPGTGTNIFDEVPVDWVSNLILLHAAEGTKDVVHASASTFVPHTWDYFCDLYGEGSKQLVWTRDEGRKRCPAAEFYGITHRDWRFETGRSKHLKKVEGKLNIQASDEELRGYDVVRRKKVMADIEAAKARMQRMREEKKRGMSGDGRVKRESRL